MCGIAGGVDCSLNRDAWTDLLEGMGNELGHRGPDDQRHWMDCNVGVGLVHTRLSIIDLSESGSQPMNSRDNRFVMVFNGEIYNFQTLKQELVSKGHHFIGGSDTEVVLAAVIEWGIDDAIERFVGMFAFALWDREAERLFLCRDRMGEKPLYYAWVDQTFIFASELKALKRHPKWSGEINLGSVADLLKYAYIPSPETIYKQVFKLPPGTLLCLDTKRNKTVSMKPYWSTFDCAFAKDDQRFTDEASALEELEHRLLESIKGQMISDVPLGAFLSGGIDSSLVTALMQAQSDVPVKTFSIGFFEQGYDESDWAQRVADHLGTDHHRMYVTTEDALGVIPELGRIYDEPFADVSQIPTFLLSRLTREHVTVSLSGDGGDELFGGYNRYFWGNNLYEKMSLFPVQGRRALSRGIRFFSPKIYDHMASMLGRVLPREFSSGRLGDKLHKFAGVMGCGTRGAFYDRLISQWHYPGSAFVDPSVWHPKIRFVKEKEQFRNFSEMMMYMDQMSYLPDDILVKMDRAAMAVGLETRVPFLDHRVVAFAWQLPLNLKVRQNKGKYILRCLLRKYLPESLIDRPKMGFGVPIDSWLRGPLRAWAGELIDPDRLSEAQIFNPDVIGKIWNAHQSGRRNFQYQLWPILMFQSWVENEKR